MYYLTFPHYLKTVRMQWTYGHKIVGFGVERLFFCCCHIEETILVNHFKFDGLTSVQTGQQLLSKLCELTYWFTIFSC